MTPNSRSGISLPQGGVLSPSTRLCRGFRLMQFGSGESHAGRFTIATDQGENGAETGGWKGLPGKRVSTFDAFRAKRRALWAKQRS